MVGDEVAGRADDLIAAARPDAPLAGTEVADDGVTIADLYEDARAVGQTRRRLLEHADGEDALHGNRARQAPLLGEAGVVEDEATAERVPDRHDGNVAGLEGLESSRKPVPPAVDDRPPELRRVDPRELVPRIDRGVSLRSKVVEPRQPVIGRDLAPSVPD